METHNIEQCRAFCRFDSIDHHASLNPCLTLVSGCRESHRFQYDLQRATITNNVLEMWYTVLALATNAARDSEVLGAQSVHLAPPS